MVHAGRLKLNQLYVHYRLMAWGNNALYTHNPLLPPPIH